MLAFLFSRAGAAMAGIVAASLFLTWSHLAAYRAGKDAERAEILTRSIEILRERNATDDDVKGMDARELCESLDGRWVDGACQ